MGVLSADRGLVSPASGAGAGAAAGGAGFPGPVSWVRTPFVPASWTAALPGRVSFIGTGVVPGPGTLNCARPI